MRSSARAARAFDLTCREALSPIEAAALLIALINSRASPWTPPRSLDLAYDALHEFSRQNLTDLDLARYQAELRRRRASGAALVSPALVLQAEQIIDVSRRTRPSAAEVKNKPRRPLRSVKRLPRSADEWIESQIKERSGAAKVRHTANQRTNAYAKLRHARLVIAGDKCETCKSTRRLQLHHIRYDTLGHETVADVRILCDTCHETETHRLAAMKRARWKSWGAGRRSRPF